MKLGLVPGKTSNKNQIFVFDTFSAQERRKPISDNIVMDNSRKTMRPLIEYSKKEIEELRFLPQPIPFSQVKERYLSGKNPRPNIVQDKDHYLINVLNESGLLSHYPSLQKLVEDEGRRREDVIREDEQKKNPKKGAQSNRPRTPKSPKSPRTTSKTPDSTEAVPHQPREKLMIPDSVTREHILNNLTKAVLIL